MDEFRNNLTRRLIGELLPDGHWEGRLSSSALSTAVAAFALWLDAPNAENTHAAAGWRWLAKHQNDDGGWGDTPESPSNVSTTLLCWASLKPAPKDKFAPVTERAEAWFQERLGSLDEADLVRSVLDHYGKDRTFSVPILTLCALAGRLGEGAAAWRSIPQLPFQLAVLPHSFFRTIRLPVVSYALPALIAVGVVRHRRAGAGWPASLWRGWAQSPALKKLRCIQPGNGGFLEATPLTAFVAMSLIGAGLGDHAVTRDALAFLTRSMRDDGSWPIDTNLATWLTSLSVQALDVDALSPDQRSAVTRYLLDAQHRRAHPYTMAASGGWAWTHLPGGVPDGDDTASALLALHKLAPDDVDVRRAATDGVRWLLGLQNRDGGIPTFCRGWGALPFDRSCPDLTAHAVRAWQVWQPLLGDPLGGQLDRAIARALSYLQSDERADGSWVPLWFGNQREEGQRNPLYGTSQVVHALRQLKHDTHTPMLRRGVDWLVRMQHDDGGWSGGSGGVPSIEETALAVRALAGDESAHARQAVDRGIAWLRSAFANGEPPPAAPIGLYFARLWYHEALYPLIFALAAANEAAHE